MTALSQPLALLARPGQAEPGHRARLVGRLVPPRRPPGRLGAVPRRGRAGRLPLHRARPAGLPAAGPGPAARRAGQAQPHRHRRHRLRRAAQGQGGARQGQGGLRPRGEAAARGRRRVPRAPARPVHRHARRRADRVGRDRPRAVAEPDLGDERAGPLPARGVRRQAGVPPARRHPRRHPGAGGAVPLRHRPRAGQPVPGHRAHLVLRRRTTSRSSSGSRSGSPTCTSSRSSRRSASGCGGRSSPSPRPCRSGSCASRRSASRSFPPLLAALANLDREIYTVIEQDLYPVEPHIPLPIQARAAGYMRSCGLGPGPALALLISASP